MINICLIFHQKSGLVYL